MKLLFSTPGKTGFGLQQINAKKNNLSNLPTAKSARFASQKPYKLYQRYVRFYFTISNPKKGV